MGGRRGKTAPDEEEDHTDEGHASAKASVSGLADASDIGKRGIRAGRDRDIKRVEGAGLIAHADYKMFEHAGACWRWRKGRARECAQPGEPSESIAVQTGLRPNKNSSRSSLPSTGTTKLATLVRWRESMG